MNKQSIRMILVEDGIHHEGLGDQARVIKYDRRSPVDRVDFGAERCDGIHSCGRIVRSFSHEKRTARQNAWARGDVEGSIIRLGAGNLPPDRHLVSCRSDVF